MMEHLKILIADDHKMFREGIRALLEKEKNIQVVAEAGTAEEIYNKLNQYPVDIILMDIDLGQSSGIEVTEVVISQFPEMKILALSMHNDQAYVVKILEAGAKGYILKNTGKEEMLNAIHAVARGDSYFSNEVSGMIIASLKKGSLPESAQKKTDIPLTNREVEVLKLIALEYSNSEIAEKLFISIRTVDTHKRNLLEKLQLKNTAGLVRYAMKKGLIDE